jgi:dynein heavy chain
MNLTATFFASQVSDVLEQWIALQRAWMYLEPVFASKDIQQQLPMEAKRFAAVDRGWRKTMDATKRGPGVIKVRALAVNFDARVLDSLQVDIDGGAWSCKRSCILLDDRSLPLTCVFTLFTVVCPPPQACCSPKLLDSLTESNKLLEAVQKGLADYLETKRLAFSRSGGRLITFV